VWNDSGSLSIGVSGSTNSLTITNSGSVKATAVSVGSANSTGNRLTVDGGYLTVTNAGTGVTDVRNGALALRNGGSITTDRLLLTNGVNSVFSFNGGTLTSGGTMETNGVTYVVGDTGGNSHFIAAGGTHNFANNMIIGNAAAGNSLTISNSAKVSNDTGTIGALGSSSNNVFLWLVPARFGAMLVISTSVRAVALTNWSLPIKARFSVVPVSSETPTAQQPAIIMLSSWPVLVRSGVIPAA